MISKRGTYSKEFKQEAVKLVTEQGYTLVVAAKSLGITASLLGKWKHKLVDCKDAAHAFPGKCNLNPTDAKYAALDKQLRKVTMERDI